MSHLSQRPTEFREPGRKPGGFTLVELLMALCIIALLAALLLPALSRARQRAYSLVCRHNAGQLTHAWLAYAEENEGVLVPNLDGAVGYQHSWLPGNVQMTLTEETVLRGPLFPYGPALRIYQCPCDGGLVAIGGRKVRRAVNYGLNIYLNGGGVTRSAVDWLGSPSVTRLGEIRAPSRVSVFLCDDPDGKAGSQFVLYPAPRDRWISFPADRHQFGTALSFADGHVEGWRWRVRKEGRWAMGMPLPVSGEADVADLRRLQATIPGAGD